ncbi:MAG: hypothetical protein Q8K75_07850 [Chlamydiales bacterium]|nr:hypothetical protein [Chlamydiales bacterium]
MESITSSNSIIPNQQPPLENEPPLVVYDVKEDGTIKQITDTKIANNLVLSKKAVVLNTKTGMVSVGKKVNSSFRKQALKGDITFKTEDGREYVNIKRQASKSAKLIKLLGFFAGIPFKIVSDVVDTIRNKMENKEGLKDRIKAEVLEIKERVARILENAESMPVAEKTSEVSKVITRSIEQKVLATERKSYEERNKIQEHKKDIDKLELEREFRREEHGLGSTAGADQQFMPDQSIVQSLNREDHQK